MAELLLGCGHARDKRLGPLGSPKEWTDLYTLDHPRVGVGQDIDCDLDNLVSLPTGRWVVLPAMAQSARFESCVDALHPYSAAGYLYCLKDNFFTEVHAYEVLEHLGSQGDAASFFAHFRNIHRILSPDGHFVATTPSAASRWLWGDPSHRRAVLPESLAFLSQEIIAANRAAKTAMSDFSHLWDLDFKIIHSRETAGGTHEFILQAIK